MIKNICNTYLFFPATENSEEFYQSIANILTDGNPIDDMGNDLESDGYVYRRNGQDAYVKI